jgi:hypothetical protein
VGIGRHTPIRERIYRVLLSSPEQEWTVRALSEATGDDISVSVARDTIYTLIAAAAMTLVPGRPAITVRLTTTGLTQLQSIANAWQAVADPESRFADAGAPRSQDVRRRRQ